MHVATIRTIKTVSSTFLALLAINVANIINMNVTPIVKIVSVVKHAFVQQRQPILPKLKKFFFIFDSGKNFELNDHKFKFNLKI